MTHIAFTFAFFSHTKNKMTPSFNSQSRMVQWHIWDCLKLHWRLCCHMSMSSCQGTPQKLCLVYYVLKWQLATKLGAQVCNLTFHQENVTMALHTEKAQRGTINFARVTFQSCPTLSNRGMHKIFVPRRTLLDSSTQRSEPSVRWVPFVISLSRTVYYKINAIQIDLRVKEKAMTIHNAGYFITILIHQIDVALSKYASKMWIKS